MTQISLLPLLSEKDPRDSAEGGLDPLGLYSISDALAVRLVPGVRERQKHARFVTTIAASLAVCDGMEELTGADVVTEPWLAFEWHVVEGLVRTADDKTDNSGLPGSLKARRALADKVPLSTKRYLKTPSVFGFHGVYRLLTRTLGIEQGGRLAETGYDLLRVWEHEQGLDGFTSRTAYSPGGKLWRDWRRSVEEGIKRGSTLPTTDWRSFRQHLDIRTGGLREAAFLGKRLHDDGTGYRGEVLCYLTSKWGWQLAKTAEERHFHIELRKVASSGLAALLDGILAYETFARLCMDAFEAVLVELTRHGTRTPVSILAGLSAVQTASRRVPDFYGEVLGKLESTGQAPRFHESFALLAEPLGVTDWLERLIAHHRQTQRRKPPDGKAPWFERFDDGSLAIRTLYGRKAEVRTPGRYVHAYRTGPLTSFALDLHLSPE